MKTSDEMVRSLFLRREQYETARRASRRRAARIAVPALLLCVTVPAGLYLLRGSRAVTVPDSVAETSASGGDPFREAVQTEPAQQESRPQAPDTVVRAAGDVTMNDHVIDSEGMMEWNGKLITFALKSALDAGDASSVYAVTLSMQPDPAYVYKGKTLLEYETEVSEERILPEKLGQLLKEGDALRYGTALYETGTPDGEKWDKNLYEARVNYYGPELLARYLADGQFLRDKLEQDFAAAQEQTSAWDAYCAAKTAFLRDAAETLPGAYLPELRAETGRIVMFVTEAELKAYHPESSAIVFGLDQPQGTDCCEEE